MFKIRKSKENQISCQDGEIQSDVHCNLTLHMYDIKKVKNGQRNM